MKSGTVKVLHPILGRPLASYSVSRAFDVGADPVVAVVGHQADAVQVALEKVFPGRPMRFALQAEQNGTAHAVGCAKEALRGFDGVVLILYGDTPLVRRETLEALLAAQRTAGAKLALVSAELEDATGYGRIVRHEGRVARVVEHRDATPEERTVREVNAGIYAVEASFLWRALDGVGTQNAQGERYLTDLVAMAAKEGEVPAVKVAWEEMAGVNDRAELAACAQVIQRRQNLALMQAGVSLLDPASTFIELGVELAADVEVGPQVSLKAGSRVAAGARIGQGCVVSASVIGEGVELKPYSVLEEAQVGARCVVGPFARLRPGTVLAEEAHVGNFVETKKTRMGKGSKANHLTYLGDAVIGDAVNVGAGTITCNYDGVNKHQTVIEDGAFIGSDSQLVAPVTVGRGATVAAGTTVTKDVPADSLVLTRPAAVVREGYRKGRKTKG